MLNLLTFTSLYPSDSQPQNGIFLENRMIHLIKSEKANIKVVAPVPWFPFGSGIFGKYARYANTPLYAHRYGIDVSYPRYPVIPAVGMSVAPILMAKALQSNLRKILNEGFQFDVIDAYYVYPDGVAAAMIAEKLGKPFVMTALGSDINVLPNHYLPRKWIKWAAGRAAFLTTVSAALKDELVKLGVPQEKISTILHGVDHRMFQPAKDKAALRKKLGIANKTLLSVGNLVEAKGHHLVIDALRNLQNVQLIIIGHGEQEMALRAQIRSLGLDNRVNMLGHRQQHDLPDFYAAADALVLASSQEGIPNVLLESMSCGTPVIAADVGGIAEIMTSHDAGILLNDRSSAAIVLAVNALFSNPPSSSDTAALARQFSWETTTQEHLEVVSRIVATR